MQGRFAATAIAADAGERQGFAGLPGFEASAGD
jgi:hypothetical protein